MASIKQNPTPPNEWLYKDITENDRRFSPFVIRPENSQPWAECTNAEKEQWEADHPQPEPDEQES